MIDEYFKDYIEIDDDIREMTAELKVKKENLYSISGISYDDIIKCRGVHFGLDFFINEIIEIERKIKNKEKEKQKEYDKHLNFILHLNDIKEQSIIKYYYLDRLPIGQIAYIFHISESHLKKTKSIAVANFEEMILNNTK